MIEILSEKPVVFELDPKLLEQRRDAAYYHPTFLSLMNSLEEFPWHLKLLKDISYPIVSGATPKAKGEAYTSKRDGIPFIRSGDLKEENIINYDDVLYIKKEIHKTMLKRSKLRKKDILVAIVGATIGKISIFNDEREANINQAIALVRIKDKNIDPLYVTYFLRSKFGQFQLDRLKRPVARANINCKEVGLIRIPIPPLHIQSKIIKTMNNALKLKSRMQQKAQDLLSQIDDFILHELDIEIPEVVGKRSYWVDPLELGGRRDPFFYHPKFLALDKAFKKCAWKIKTIGEITKKIINGIDLRKYVEEGTPYLRVENIKENMIDLSDVKRVERKPEELRKAIQLSEGDILFTRKASYGICAVVTKALENAIISSEIIRLVPKSNINPFYIAAFLNSRLGKMQSNRMAVGTIMPGINHPSLKSIKVIIPPVEIQNKIADEVRRRTEKARKLLENAKEVVEKARNEVERIIRGKECHKPCKV